jgi:DNA processing protein
VGAGWTVESGGAFGIDAAAHRGALGGGGLMIAIVAGGLREPYPRAHESLFM